MNIRQRLVFIFLVVVFLVLGLAGYAASIYRNNLAATDTIWVNTRDELISAHRAQVSFDRQKLAWENLVLRGYDTDRYYQYLSQFYDQERATRAAVASLLSTLDRSSEPAQAAIRFLTDHKFLGKHYRDALKVFNVADDPAFATDSYISDAVDMPSALLDEVIDKVVFYHGQELEQLEVRINDELLRLWLFSALGLLFLLAALVWFIDRKIGRPLEAITRVARGIRDGDLQQRVSHPSTDEIGILAETINAMLDRLEIANLSLADKLSELGEEFNKRQKIEFSLEARTIELEEMNQELKAFNYTIAHDLRTPLRAITGFSQLLQDDLKGQIDPEHQDALDRVSSAGLRLANQIDHILQLSRISTSEIILGDVDLSHLAGEVVQELRDNDRQRDVRVDIQPGLHTTGDAGLLRVVMQNLLGNAWKYTSNEDRPVISFSSGEENGQVVYRVSDNGSGFDMAYADKLFGVFERLHNAAEFEGHGVGLASVKRAIRRHGGWITGKGEPGKGAEFIFALNQRSAQLKPLPVTV